jgi:hypothetical protein
MRQSLTNHRAENRHGLPTAYGSHSISPSTGLLGPISGYIITRSRQIRWNYRHSVVAAWGTDAGDLFRLLTVLSTAADIASHRTISIGTPTGYPEFDFRWYAYSQREVLERRFCPQL